MSIIKKTTNAFPLFGGALSDLFDSENFFDNSLFKKDWIPAVNVKEKENSYEIEMAVPGFVKEDFKLTTENGILTVSSEKKEEKKEEEKNYTRREYSFNSFSRSFALPENADEEGISANYKNGILNISVQKKVVAETKKTRNIAVN